MTTLNIATGPQQPVAQASSTTPWLMLFSRISLFAAFQAGLALLFATVGQTEPWASAANWWPLTVAAVDAVMLLLLIRLFAAEGGSFWRLFRIERNTVKGDLLVMLIVVLVTGPVSYFPNIWLGQALYGSPEATLELIVRPLPFWAVYTAMLFFALGQGLTELPTYFGYVAPRLHAQGMRRWMAVSLPALMLALQHIAVPLLFDARFMAWRAFMFLPFAFLVGALLTWRPRLMPYVVVVHLLMDMAFAAMLLNVAY